MQEMIEQAVKFGYQYLAFSEHNPSISEHSAKQNTDLIKYKRERVNKLNEKYEKQVKTMKILNSLEIDIRPDGQLALPDKAFNYLDMAIVSIHSSFRQTRKQATDRVLKALEHPKVKIWGHPTGRIINKREGLEFDWDKIFDYCIKNKKWIEIDGWPDRLDLPDTLVREAIKQGVKLTIGSDAHQVNHMSMLKYGVSVARRGWAEKEDIINTLSWKELKKLLN
jgi:DNA polymerase (family 10)